MIRRWLTFLISIYVMIAEQAIRIASGYLLRRALREVLGR